jgi:hypothetical protein
MMMTLGVEQNDSTHQCTESVVVCGRESNSKMYHSIRRVCQNSKNVTFSNVRIQM